MGEENIDRGTYWPPIDRDSLPGLLTSFLGLSLVKRGAFLTIISLSTELPLPPTSLIQPCLYLRTFLLQFIPILLFPLLYFTLPIGPKENSLNPHLLNSLKPSPFILYRDKERVQLSQSKPNREFRRE